MLEDKSKHNCRVGRKPPKGSNSLSAPDPTADILGTAGNQQATSGAWQRSQGAFSGKAKKEYLRWKRQQKAVAGSTDADSSDWGPDESTAATAAIPADSSIRHSSVDKVPQHPARGDYQSSQAQPAKLQQPQGSALHAQQPAPAVLLHSIEHASHVPASSLQDPALSGQDDPTLPLLFRPLVAVPAARFSATSADASAVTATTEGANRAEPQHNVVYLPQLNPIEVGFTPEGFALDMPTRPKWEGLVTTAEQLHKLEEQHFAAWQAALLQVAAAPATSSLAPMPTDVTEWPVADSTSSSAAVSSSLQQPRRRDERQDHELQQEQQQQHNNSRAGGIGRLSFYEGRLELWRQLWRTLEMSDAVLMIVDARNPLLHFSYALYRHVTQQLKLPMLLLLNKSDLVPAAAVSAWQRWLHQHLPGLQVLPVSAAPEQAKASVKAVLGRVLGLTVQRAGKHVNVQDIVGMSVDSLVEVSIARNIHAKRQTQQQALADATTAAAAVANATETEAGWGLDMHSSSSELNQPTVKADKQKTSDASEDWSLQPKQRKQGTRRGRHRLKLVQQQRHPQQQQQQQDKQLQGFSEMFPGQHIQALEDSLEGLTVERTSAGSIAAATDVAASAASSKPLLEFSTAAGLASSGADDNAAGRKQQRQPKQQPVVIGLLGEPNVGKSSTLNALLGSHRVAVSCHPGRTKHYQTHWMSDKLVLCDCPGIVFPRLDVAMPMQVRVILYLLSVFVSQCYLKWIHVAVYLGCYKVSTVVTSSLTPILAANAGK
eukprot:GHRR01010375.1.p1 GENE.GHRR01010375.1~~GHRR01010375.1.p1  ORF type:complete len:771 (+),score=321.28 GHRR01010375.1:261-2573(+)